MKKIASLARVLAAVVSFAYMLLLTPHIGSVGSDANLNAHPIYILAWIMAIIWVPLLVIHIVREKLQPSTLNVISLSSLGFELVFFVFLFLAA